MKIVSIANCARLDKLVFQTHAYHAQHFPMFSFLLQTTLSLKRQFSFKFIYL